MQAIDVSLGQQVSPLEPQLGDACRFVAVHRAYGSSIQPNNLKDFTRL
jgi:hypothetical protein